MKRKAIKFSETYLSQRVGDHVEAFFTYKRTMNGDEIGVRLYVVEKFLGLRFKRQLGFSSTWSVNKQVSMQARIENAESALLRDAKIVKELEILSTLNG